MTDGTSQGLFIVVAIVIFGIFVAMAYILFEDTLSPAIANMMGTATEQATNRLNKGEDTTIPEDNGEIEESRDSFVDTYEGSEFYYNKNTATTYSITGYIGESKDVVIPYAVLVEGIEYTIDGIGTGAFHGKNLTSVVIPDTIKRMGHQAFQGNKLTNIYIPDSVTNIQGGVFLDNLITEVELPSGIWLEKDPVAIEIFGAVFDPTVTITYR